MARKGRSIPIREELRKDILRLIFFWEDWLLHGGMIDSLGLTLALLPMHQEMQQLPERLRFRSLLVDEFQDLSSLDLQVLRRVVPINLPDSLFLAGDTVQRVLVKRLSLAEAGLDRGPAAYASIKKNYRNSRQILRAAARLANHYGAIASSQGEDIEVLDPELAQRETNPPVVLATDNSIQKAWELVLECLNGDERTERWTISVVTAAPDKITIEAILNARPVNVAARHLTGDSIDRPDEVTVGSIKDLKGFEFRMVVIVGCSKELLPDPGVPVGEEWRDALRLYVAMTRGRDQVYLIYEGEASPYISVMGDAVVSREETARTLYLRAADSLELASNGASERIVPRLPQSISGRDPDTNCEDAFTATELEVLKKYYAQKVHRPNLTFKEWCHPRNLATIRQRLLNSTRRVRPDDAEAVLGKLRRLGILGAEFGAPRVAPKAGRCQASNCAHAPIPGEEFCYEHKTE